MGFTIGPFFELSRAMQTASALAGVQGSPLPRASRQQAKTRKEPLNTAPFVTSSITALGIIREETPYSALSEAISIENRYFTSDFTSLS